MPETPSTLERAAARNLVKNYLHVKPGENVIVESWTHTLPMASAMVDEVRRAGGGAFLEYEDEDAWWRAVERKQTRLLGRLTGPELAALKAADAYVMFWGPADSARLEKVPSKNLDETAVWFDRWYKTARSTGLRGVRMDLGFVNDARVRHWGVRKEAWTKGILQSCLVDPKEMTESGKRLARAFAGTRKVRITHRNGTDLEVALAGVPSRTYDGTPHARNKAYREFDMLSNVPGGRVVTALDAKTAEGKIVATHPSYDLTWYPWQRYSGGTFEFSGGKLTSFSFEEGEAEFAKHYAEASPGKNRTGQLQIGLNPRARDLPYPENIQRGLIRLTVGANAYAGGNNPSDFCGWVSLADSEVSVDGIPVIRAGKIL